MSDKWDVSFDDMTMEDLLAYIQRSETALRRWLVGHTNAGGRIGFNDVREALQSIVWGREVVVQVLNIKLAEEAAASMAPPPLYDQDEATWFIRQRTELPEDTIRAVLNADEAYMEDKGILAPVDDQDDIETVGPVQ